jgi:peptidoglycan-associated lipoprotein
MRRLHFLVLVAIAAATMGSGCGGNPPAPPPPEPTVDNTAREDSIRRAQEEEERRRREEEERMRREREAAERGRMAEEARAALAALIHFDYDRADIRSGDAATLDQKVSVLNANPGLRIRVSGHCDERGSDEYNLALGNRRANAAKEYLVSHGVDAGRIETVSFGEERPIAMGRDEDSWAQNRRAEFEVIAGELGGP